MPAKEKEDEREADGHLGHRERQGEEHQRISGTTTDPGATSSM